MSGEQNIQLLKTIGCSYAFESFNLSILIDNSMKIGKNVREKETEMKKLAAILMSVLFFVQMAGNSFAVQYMDIANGGILLPIDPDEVEYVYIDGYYTHLDKKGKAMDMKKDNPSTHKRVPLSYPANISIRVPKDSKVKAGYLGSQNPEYRVEFENGNYRAELELLPRESMIGFNGGREDAKVKKETLSFFKKNLNPSAKFISKGYVKTTMDYERATTAKADYLVGILGNGGAISIKVVAKSNKVNKEWMNDIISGLELFDSDQQISFFQTGNTDYTNSIEPISEQDYAQRELYYLKDYYKTHGRTYGTPMQASAPTYNQVQTTDMTDIDYQAIEDVYRAPSVWGHAVADALEEGYKSVGMDWLYADDLEYLRWQADHYWDPYTY